MENRVYCHDIETFARLIMLFQEQGLAFTAHANEFYIDVTGY